MVQEETNCNSNYKPSKWYNKYIFPLIPIIRITKAGVHNTSGFSFKWLIFTIWTLDHPGFEFTVVVDTHWGFGFIGLFPYIRWAITIPCPMWLDRWISKHLNRDRNLNYLTNNY